MTNLLIIPKEENIKYMLEAESILLIKYKLVTWFHESGLIEVAIDQILALLPI
jgi:hypothetical protein